MSRPSRALRALSRRWGAGPAGSRPLCTSAAATDPAPEDPARTQLELLRRSNASMEHLTGQTILVKVSDVDRRFAALETGYRVPAKFAKRELPLDRVVARGAGGAGPGGPQDVRRGDVFQMKIVTLQTPYGDMQLDTLGGEQGTQPEAVWAELVAMKRQRQPVLGRILNTVKAGYAVGVGGIVCFCPASRCTPATGKRIGILQPFIIEDLNVGRQSVVLVDVCYVVAKKRTQPPTRPVFPRR